MNTSMDILGVKYKFGPSVFYLFGPLVKNLVLRFSIYSVLRIRSTIPVRFTCDSFIDPTLIDIYCVYVWSGKRYFRLCGKI